METGKGGFSRNLKSEAKKFKVPVPAKWKDKFEVPQDFKEFLKDIYPNLKYVLQINPILNEDDADSVVSEMAIYFLEVSKKRGICRYQMYDPIKYPNIPYHKWFLNQVQYFVLSYKKNFALWNNFQRQYKEEASDPVKTLPCTKQNESVWVGNILVEEFLSATQNVSDADEGFKKHAYELTLSRLSGEPNTVFAAEKGVPYSRVVSWMSKLRELLSDFEFVV